MRTAAVCCSRARAGCGRSAGTLLIAGLIILRGRALGVARFCEVHSSIMKSFSLHSLSTWSTAYGFEVCGHLDPAALRERATVTGQAQVRVSCIVQHKPPHGALIGVRCGGAQAHCMQDGRMGCRAVQGFAQRTLFRSGGGVTCTSSEPVALAASLESLHQYAMVGGGRISLSLAYHQLIASS